jgi:hypothetical protein
MNWRPRLVSPKEQSTDACCLALCDRVASGHPIRRGIFGVAECRACVLVAFRTLSVHDPEITAPVSAIIGD